MAVVGGGIIGLTTSFYLEQRGFDVTLFDPHAGQGATWASAGMIAPLSEITPGEEQGFSLQVRAPRAWEELSQALERVTGKQLPVVSSGTLFIGFNASDVRQIDQFATVMESFGARHQSVTRESHETYFAGISDRITSGLLLDGDYWIDPDKAVSLLTEGLEILEVDIVAELVHQVKRSNNYVVTSESGEFSFDRMVFCTGDQRPPIDTPFTNLVRPVRGTTVRLQGFDRSSMPMIRAIVKGRAFYYVCRPGGYTVIGATSEEQPSPHLEVGEMQRLLRDALDVIPELETAEIVEYRSGVRPASLNGEPFEEYVDDFCAVWASGHYRHGVTLAPITAASIADTLKP